MTVKQLREALAHLPDHLPVFVHRPTDPQLDEFDAITFMGSSACEVVAVSQEGASGSVRLYLDDEAVVL